jgi:heme oxygenase
VLVFNISEVKVTNAEKTAIIMEGKQVFVFIFKFFHPMSKLASNGKAMISMYFLILITEINIYSGRN